MSGPEGQQPLLAAAAPELVRSLEASVAAHPNDPERARELAQVYLNAHQPGLAVALVGGAPATVRDNVRVEHLFARALIEEGRDSEAFRAERRVVDACGVLTEGHVAPAGCNSALLVSAMHRADILRELLSLGIEDAAAQPEATFVAYQNATREARIALE
jgi:hypothetical protein